MFRWGRLAFGSSLKALGFVILAEGVMTFCSTTWLSLIALGYLVVINAIATGCTIALGAAQDHAAAAAPSIPDDITAQRTATLNQLDARFASLESAPAKRARKRTVRKPASPRPVTVMQLPLPAAEPRETATA